MQAQLDRADLHWATLAGADLKQADLTWADLRGVDLRWANLADARLICAGLCEANLRHASLFAADLRGAKLCAANLAGVNLRNARIADADFTDVVITPSTVYEPSFELRPGDEAIVSLDHYRQVIRGSGREWGLPARLSLLAAVSAAVIATAIALLRPHH